MSNSDKERKVFESSKNYLSLVGCKCVQVYMHAVFGGARARTHGLLGTRSRDLVPSPIKSTFHSNNIGMRF